MEDILALKQPAFVCSKCNHPFQTFAELRNHVEANICTNYVWNPLEVGCPEMLHLSQQAKELEKQLFYAKTLEASNKKRRQFSTDLVVSRSPRYPDIGSAKIKLKSYAGRKIDNEDYADAIYNEKKEPKPLPHLDQEAKDTILMEKLKTDLITRDELITDAEICLQDLSMENTLLQKKVEDFSSLQNSKEGHIKTLENDVQRIAEEKDAKEREVDKLASFLQTIAEKETETREKLENFMESLLNRTERAESKLEQLMSGKQIDPHESTNQLPVSDEAETSPVQRSANSFEYQQNPSVNVSDHHHKIYTPPINSQPPSQERNPVQPDYATRFMQSPPSPSNVSKDLKDNCASLDYIPSKMRPSLEAPYHYQNNTMNANPNDMEMFIQPSKAKQVYGMDSSYASPATVQNRGTMPPLLRIPTDSSFTSRNPTHFVSTRGDQLMANLNYRTHEIQAAMVRPHSIDSGIVDVQSHTWPRTVKMDSEGVLWEVPPNNGTGSHQSHHNDYQPQPKPNCHTIFSSSSDDYASSTSLEAYMIPAVVSNHALQQCPNQTNRFISENRQFPPKSLKLQEKELKKQLRTLKQQQKKKRSPDVNNGHSPPGVNKKHHGKKEGLKPSSPKKSQSRCSNEKERKAVILGSTTEVLPEHFDTLSDNYYSSNEDSVGQMLSPRMSMKRQKDALFCVFSYLDTKALCIMSQVSWTWHRISRHPALWRNLSLSYSRISSKILKTFSKWCTQVQALNLESLKPRNKRKNENKTDYSNSVRGCLEKGLEVLFHQNATTLQSLRVMDCGLLVTEKCLWLLSCHCKQLERLVYISDICPVGQEVLWALGAGCKKIHTMIVPPSYPCHQPGKFSNKCLTTIAKYWPHIKVLCIGGVSTDPKGLLTIAKYCIRIEVLELDHMGEMKEDTAVGMCNVGLRALAALEFIYTPVTPEAVVHFNSVCPNLKKIAVHLGISDYFEDSSSEVNRKKYKKIAASLQNLKMKPAFLEILHVKTDYG